MAYLDAGPTVLLCKWLFLLPEPNMDPQEGSIFEATETREEQRWDGLGRFFKAVLVDRPRSPLVGVWVGSVMGSYPSSDSSLCLGPPSPGSQDGD